MGDRAAGKKFWGVPAHCIDSLARLVLFGVENNQSRRAWSVCSGYQTHGSMMLTNRFADRPELDGALLTSVLSGTQVMAAGAVLFGSSHSGLMMVRAVDFDDDFEDDFGDEDDLEEEVVDDLEEEEEEDEEEGFGDLDDFDDDFEDFDDDDEAF